MPIIWNQLASVSFLCLIAAFVQCNAGIVSWATFGGGLYTQNNMLLSEINASVGMNCLNDKMYIIPQNSTKESDKIYELPGQPVGVDFNQYAGYVTVASNAGRALFYYFAESPNDPSMKPLVLWLNGGPGCSSVGYGLFEELGPFKVNKDGRTLYKNDYSWNKDANMLFLESPAGVGFSYSNKTSDYDLSGDNRTAHDAYIFLLNWLERFPEYKSRDFYITGESYGGHYIPQLSQRILHNNNCGNFTSINLREIAIGNGLIDFETYAWGTVDYMWTHALISDEMQKSIHLNCNFANATAMSDLCNYYVNLTSNATGNINPYEIYAPLCNSSQQSVQDTTFDPCTDNYVTNYLNLPEVQQALHANATNIPYPWQLCNMKINAIWKDSATSTLSVMQELMNNGVLVWLYSGDVDSVVSVTATKYAINKLNIHVKIPWYAWYYEGEVGGYVVGYENLTFVTVRGAGHEVPSYQPARAFAMFTSFLTNELPPTK